MGIGIWHFAIIFFSVIVLLVPIEQANANFWLPPEWTEEELLELYKQKQLLRVEQVREENVGLLELYKQEEIFRAEQVRDQILDFQITRLHNPYHDTEVEVIITYERNFENGIPKVVQREHEIFQTLKAEQIDLAEKKYLEILGGKTITNLVDIESREKIIQIREFKIDNQVGFMARNHEDFQNYKLEEIAIAEKTIDKMVEEGLWASHPYINYEKNEVSTVSIDNQDHQPVTKRSSEEFKNLILEQILLAEQVRDQILDFQIIGVQNPYEKSYEKLNDVQEEVIEQSEPKAFDRNHETFQSYKDEQVVIAQTTLNKIFSLKNSENIKDEITNEKEQFSMNDEEISKPIVYDRYDELFQLSKQNQEDKAKKKLIEILGGKKIHNPDYLDFEIKKLYCLNFDKNKNSEYNILTSSSCPVYEKNVENIPVQNIPVQNIPVQNTPVQNTPVQNTPVQNTPVQNTPVQNTPVQNIPVLTPVSGHCLGEGFSFLINFMYEKSICDLIGTSSMFGASDTSGTI